MESGEGNGICFGKAVAELEYWSVGVLEQYADMPVRRADVSSFGFRASNFRGLQPRSSPPRIGLRRRTVARIEPRVVHPAHSRINRAA